MGTGEIVVHEVEGKGEGVILQLLAEGVGQPREATHRHAHRQVVPLGVAGGDGLRVGPARNPAGTRSDAFGGAIALLAVWLRAVHFDQHRIVDVGAESRFDRFEDRPCGHR